MEMLVAVEPKVVVMPRWAKFSSLRDDEITVSKLFVGLGRAKLNSYCDNGDVRRKKTGDGKSDGVLYCITDIIELFEGVGE